MSREFQDKKEILLGLERGTEIDIIDNGKVEKAVFLEMKRTRFTIEYKDSKYSVPVSFFKSVSGEEINFAKRYANEKMNFVKKNVNPANNRIGDCVVRSIAEALNKSWEQVMMDLTIEGCKIGKLFNSKDVYESYMHQHGFRELAVRKQSIRDYINNNRLKGTYVVLVKRHLTVIKNNDLIDTWDCSSEKIQQVFKLL